MSVEETNSSDVISTDKRTAEVILTVSDHLEWPDTLTHQAILQAKLNGYLRFVESGEILERHPAAKGRRRVFSIALKVAPDQKGRDFLAQAKQIVESAGIGFRYELFAASNNN